MVQKASQWLLAGIPFSLCFSQRLNGMVLLLYLLAVILQPDLPGRFRRAVRLRWLVLAWTDEIEGTNRIDYIFTDPKDLVNSAYIRNAGTNTVSDHHAVVAGLWLVY